MALSYEIKIIQWNARSLCGRISAHKISELINFLETFKELPEVVCIQETWIRDKNFQLNLKGYKQITSFHRKNDEKGGGVATFVKEGLDSEKINYSQTSENLEVAIARIFGTKTTLDIVNIYTNGNQTIKET